MMQGSDQDARAQQFDYSSNVVIQRESRVRNDEPTGEPESLSGRIDPKSMGGLSQRTKPKQAEQLKAAEKQKKKRQQPAINLSKKTKMKIDSTKDVTSISIDDTIIYRPKTKENRLLYEQIISFVNSYLQDQPQEFLRSVTDEVIAVLKTDNQQDKGKKQDIERLFGSIVLQEQFDHLLSLSKQITDYKAENQQIIDSKQEEEFRENLVNIDEDEGAGEDDEGDLMGVAVGRAADGGDADDPKNMNQQVQDSGGEDDEDGDENGANDNWFEEQQQGIHTKGGMGAGDDMNELEEEDQQYHVEVNEIDAYWLQSQLNKYCKDEMEAQRLESQVLEILNADSDAECEKKLVMLLNYERFQLIKVLLKNRYKIYFCTLINQAQGKEERDAVINTMQKSPFGKMVLELINQKSQTRRGKDKDSFKQIKKEIYGMTHMDSKDQDMDDVTVIGGKQDSRGSGGQAKLMHSQYLNVMEDEQFNKIQKKVLNLEELSFQTGSHFMSNDKCRLPPESYRLNKKGYDEIYVPAIKVKPQDTKLIKVEEMDKWAQTAFQGISQLNLIQSIVYQTALKTAENMLICAPTGAGKTNIALLSMLQVIGNYIQQDGSIDKNKFKIVYIAPMKALVAEMVGSFSRRLEKLGLVVRELTGDMQLSKQQIEETQLIVATPEKWDIITRKSGERTYTDLVKLLIIDEIHLLHDMRGPVLEALVARTIRTIEQNQEMIRIVGLSATLPNYVDVATLLRVKHKQGLFYFDYSYRPVPLEQQYIGITEKKAVRRMMLMNEILYEKAVERAGKYPIIVFVHSRRETIKTANAIKEMAYAKDELSKFLKEDSDSYKILQAVLEKEKINSTDLKELLPFGFAIHHAGLSRMDRDLVESLFSDRHIQVLVSTSTLAWGVNLPAHTVIIKGTQIYSPEQGKWMELSGQDVLQMMGRAGRPRYDTKGEGIIITGYQELKFYLSLLNQQVPIESQFIAQLPDQLNAEIVLGSVANLRDAVTWLGYTYLYIRMMRNPRLYGVPLDDSNINQTPEDDPLLVGWRSSLVHSAASLLDKHGLIKYDKRTGQFQITALGRISSHYYIKYPSVAVYNEHLKPNMGMIELLKVFSLSNEFKYIPIREEEKIELQKMIESVPVPIKGSPEDPPTKINILLQSYIGRLPLNGFALNADMVYATQSASRIMRALFEICLKRKWAQSTEVALGLCKMVDKRMWSCMTLLRQFRGIPEEILRRIERKEQFTFEHFYQMSPQQIGELVKLPKIGKVLHKLIHQFPRLELQPYLQPITRSCLKIDLTITPDFNWEDAVHGKSEPFWIFVTDCDGEEILYSEYFHLKKKYIGIKDYQFQFTVPLFEYLHPIYYIKVISDRWLQSEATMPISFKNLILPEKFAAPTELLDMQLQPISSLKWPEAEKLFTQKLKIRQFNQIQTQVFQTFFTSTDNIFLGASTGAGKTTCALLAILRVFRKSENGQGVDDQSKVVYVAPYESICLKQFLLWQHLFESFGKSVAMLTGQGASIDMQIMQKNDLIIATPEQWDTMTRRWKTKKILSKIALFIADELHLLSEGNCVLEVIVSRMCYISKQLEKRCQIIGLATSVADYKEMAAWIGAPASNTFNFHPSARPVQLLIELTGFEQNQRKARLHQMQKLMYNNMKQYANSQDQQVIIFVNDRRQARLTAIDLLSLAASDNTPNRFLHISEEKIREICSGIQDTFLSHVLAAGIGYVFEGMDPSERQAVEKLFGLGVIQVIVCTYLLSWELECTAPLIVILDSQRYDGQEKRYIDYTIPDMLQMIGRVGRSKEAQYQSTIKKQQEGAEQLQQESSSSQSSRCLVYCHSVKKEFYKKFLFEPYPVESHLNHFISNHLCAEVAAKQINSKQDCIDWITWTFMYWRLTKNPNYYNLQEVSGSAINDYLSELIETTVQELAEMKCLAIEEEVELIPLNLGIISSFYYINTATIELFAQNIQEDSKVKQLIGLISNSSEFDACVPVRHKEETVLAGLNQQIKFKVEAPNLQDPASKVQILLQSHFSRIPLSSDFVYDQKIILEHTVRLVHALIDVISSNCWLQQVIKAMQLCQMVVQACWLNSSPLLQLPYINEDIVAEFKKENINDIPDFLNMNDNDRMQLLQEFNKEQIEEIARASNRYPTLTMKHKVMNKDNIVISGDALIINVTIERDEVDLGEGGELNQQYVYAPYYPKQKEELWWLIIGDKESNKLYTIKRVQIKQKLTIDLKFNLPETELGQKILHLFLICDSYIGCDQSEILHIMVNKAKKTANEQ